MFSLPGKNLSTRLWFAATLWRPCCFRGTVFAFRLIPPSLSRGNCLHSQFWSHDRISLSRYQLYRVVPSPDRLMTSKSTSYSVIGSDCDNARAAYIRIARGSIGAAAACDQGDSHATMNIYGQATKARTAEATIKSRRTWDIFPRLSTTSRIFRLLAKFETWSRCTKANFSKQIEIINGACTNISKEILIIYKPPKTLICRWKLALLRAW